MVCIESQQVREYVRVATAAGSVLYAQSEWIQHNALSIAVVMLFWCTLSLRSRLDADVNVEASFDSIRFK